MSLPARGRGGEKEVSDMTREENVKYHAGQREGEGKDEA
jgi:hypothetical protein